MGPKRQATVTWDLKHILALREYFPLQPPHALSSLPPLDICALFRDLTMRNFLEEREDSYRKARNCLTQFFADH